MRSAVRGVAVLRIHRRTFVLVSAAGAALGTCLTLTAKALGASPDGRQVSAAASPSVVAAAVAGAAAGGAALLLVSTALGLRRDRWRIALARVVSARRGGLPEREADAVSAIAARNGFPLFVLPAGRSGDRRVGGHGWSPASGLRQVEIRHTDVDGVPGALLDVGVHVGDVPPPWTPGLAVGSSDEGPGRSHVPPEHRDVAALPPITVIVDGTPVTFDARADGPDRWTALGHVPGAWIRLNSTSVAADGLTLVRLSGTLRGGER